MGRAKFLFPNDEGIYLHDTPDKDLMAKRDRHLSNGCIRLEDARRLGKWLLGRPIKAASKEPEQVVALPVGVRSEEHTSELQSLMRISYAVFCLKQKSEDSK